MIVTRTSGSARSIEQFGVGHRKIPVRMDFTAIERRWLREIVKEVTWVRMARQGVGPTSAHRTLVHMAHFERWAGERLDRGPEAIDRRLLEDYLAHVRGLPYSDAEREHRLVSLDTMLSLARALEIESFSPSACYLRGELAQRTDQRLPRFYDEHVAAQFDDPANRARLTDPAARIAFLVMRHGGLRISSACSLKLDCVVVDPGGQPWLRYLDHKGDDEDLVPIAAEVAEEIRAQQQRVRERFPNTPWLLPAERANRDGHKHLCDSEVRRRLARWVLECDIREQSGAPIEFKPHRFRHTIATELINGGLSKTGIQRFLSHESGAMTDVYAHMLDQTLKQEWLADQGAGQRRRRARGADHPGDRRRRRVAQAPARPSQADAPGRRVRAADPAELPAPQRLPLMPALPHRRALPAGARGAARARRAARRRRRARRPRAAGGDQPPRRARSPSDHRRPGPARRMSRPQPEALAAFQRQRSAQRRNAVIAAIRTLDRAGQPVTVAAVATLAGVDRSYIYDQLDLLEEIRQRRAMPVKPVPRPAAERATIASLQARLASAHDEIARLKAENRKLRERLAIALGDAWQAEIELPHAAGEV